MLKAMMEQIPAHIAKFVFVIEGGSGSGYIYGFCDKNWRPGMTEEECKAFVVQSVSHAMARDGSSGGNMPNDLSSIEAQAMQQAQDKIKQFEAHDGGAGGLYSG